ncbi:Panacea domain-containing protein [Paracoccus ravus]|uniref:Panacea domain-containing protein n=1 Tax=Paracoccus ravus TaxID=2447760 RepID=UPI00106E23FE|nr:type II toxin-antitoxin system antitoxin SocA domain-containing protein [Paracoccus ravus]
MYDAITIADDILKLAKAKGKTLTPMQLMKLTYIAHGWALAILKRDLFRNRIEAWQYGPVIPDLYHATKSYGGKSIPFSAVGDPDTPSTDPETRSFLQDVFEKYGHMDGITLSYLTHQSGTPWDQVYVPNVRRIEIPDELIKKHYSELLLARQEAA